MRKKTPVCFGQTGVSIVCSVCDDYFEVNFATARTW